MPISAEQIKKTYSGYTGWNDPASIVADYLATGGSGKGAAPYALGKQEITAPKTTTTTTPSQTGEEPITIEGLLGRLATPSTEAYQTAAEAESAQLPLIQQRYKSLLDEISQTEKETTAETEQTRESQLGEARARSAATGTYYGSTELGGEDVIRRQALQTITSIKGKALTQKEQTLADQAIEEGNVTKAIANLGIKQSEAERSGLKDALSTLIDLKKVSLQEKQVGASLGKGVVAQTAEGVMLVNPYTGKVISRIGSPKATGAGQQLLKAKLGKDVVAQIQNFDKNVVNDTGSAKALGIYAKLNFPVIGGALITKDEAKYKELQGLYFSLVQAALTSIQGSRPSDYDVKSYMQNVGMGINSSPEANQAGLNNLLTILGGGAEGASDISSLWD